MNEKNVLILKKGLRLGGVVLLGIAVTVIFALLFAVIVKELWNWLMPGLFGLPAVTFLQAFGLIVLARLFVGGGHGGRHHRDLRSSKEGHFHRLLDSEHGRLPGEIRLHRKSFMKFWEVQGRKDFEEYRKGESS